MNKKPSKVLTVYGTISGRTKDVIEKSNESLRAKHVSLAEIFLTFFVIGATSFGGGVVAYLRAALVLRKAWLNEEQFFSSLEISQALPGLNSTNMAVIVGDRLRGPIGAAAAFFGLCLPGVVLVFVLGYFYVKHEHNPHINLALKGVGAVAVGLLSAVTLQISHKQMERVLDIAIVVLTIFLVSFLKISLLVVLLTLGPIAIFLYRPRSSLEIKPGNTGTDRRPTD